MKDQEGLIALLGEENAELEPSPSTPPAPVRAEAPVLTEEDWQDDPVPRKWEKIRAVFLNAKTAAEVREAAMAMPVRSWLDWACRMTQKQIDLPPLQITTVVVEMPAGYAGPEPEEVEIELPPSQRNG